MYIFVPRRLCFYVLFLINVQARWKALTSECAQLLQLFLLQKSGAGGGGGMPVASRFWQPCLIIQEYELVEIRVKICSAFVIMLVIKM